MRGAAGRGFPAAASQCTFADRTCSAASAALAACESVEIPEPHRLADTIAWIAAAAPALAIDPQTLIAAGGAQGAQDFGTQIAVSGGENRVAAALARSNAGKIDEQATVDQVGGCNMRELGIVR